MPAEVYKLKGGIQHYGNTVGSEGWKAADMRLDDAAYVTLVTQEKMGDGWVMMGWWRMIHQMLLFLEAIERWSQSEFQVPSVSWHG